MSALVILSLPPNPERQRRGTLGVLLGQAAMPLGGNARDLGRPIDRVGLLALHEQIPHGDRVATAHLSRAGDCRRVALGVVDGVAGDRIDDEVGVLLGRLRLSCRRLIDRRDLLVVAESRPSRRRRGTASSSDAP